MLTMRTITPQNKRTKQEWLGWMVTKLTAFIATHQAFDVVDRDHRVGGHRTEPFHALFELLDCELVKNMLAVLIELGLELMVALR